MVLRMAAGHLIRHNHMRILHIPEMLIVLGHVRDNGSGVVYADAGRNQQSQVQAGGMQRSTAK